MKNDLNKKKKMVGEKKIAGDGSVRAFSLERLPRKTSSTR